MAPRNFLPESREYDLLGYVETQALMNMRISGIFSLALLSAVQLQAAELATRLVSLPGSTVKVEGTSKLHDWWVEGEVINGSVQCGAGFPEIAGQGAGPGKLQSQMEGFIPVNSLHTFSEGKVMDGLVCSGHWPES